LLLQLVFDPVLVPENTAYPSNYLIVIKTSQKIVIETTPHTDSATDQSCNNKIK